MTIKERLERIRFAEFLTAQDVALLLRYSQKTIYKKVKRGEMPGVVKLGTRTLRFRRVAIARWARENFIDTAI